jgi:tryptophanyl-tRNA synthetase
VDGEFKVGGSDPRASWLGDGDDDEMRRSPFKRLPDFGPIIKTSMFSSPLKRATAPISRLSKCIRHNSTSQLTRPRTIFSGIQPTGVPHLGNYLGALQRWVKLQDEAADDTVLLYSLVDLHAITVRQDAAQLRQWKRESLATMMAVGLDPKRSILYYQSDVYRLSLYFLSKANSFKVPEHAELMWILSCTASVGYLSRMTQWKSKLNVQDHAKPFDTPLQLGLFSYPVLMAADILLYR